MTSCLSAGSKMQDNTAGGGKSLRLPSVIRCLSMDLNNEQPSYKMQSSWIWQHLAIFRYEADSRLSKSVLPRTHYWIRWAVLLQHRPYFGATDSTSRCAKGWMTRSCRCRSITRSWKPQLWRQRIRLNRLEFNEGDFERSARSAHARYGIASPGSLNEMLANLCFEG